MSVTHQWFSRAQGSVGDMGLYASMGLIPGVSVVHKFGAAPDIDTGTDPQDIWDYGATEQDYTFMSTAATLYLSSSAAGDGQDIEVQGLDANWALQTVTETLSGQTQTEIGTGVTWLRVFRAKNVGSTDLAGSVFIYENPTGTTAGVPDETAEVRAHISTTVAGSEPNNQTEMAIYTVPLGKTAYIVNWGCSLNKKLGGTKAASLVLQVRENGGVFQVKQDLSLQEDGTGTSQREFSIPLSVPAQADIKVRCMNVTANDTAIAAWFDFYLIDD